MASKITKYVKYHNDGTIWGRGSMKDGKMHGAWAWFRKDGTKMRSGFFAKGKQTGKWVTYDRKGKPFKTTVFK